MNHCHHCGDSIKLYETIYKDKSFCCEACKTVYEILSGSDLTQYYSIDSEAGINPQKLKLKDYSYLDSIEYSNKLLEFKDDSISVMHFSLPTIHCSSCIWLLENLFKINSGIKKTLVNFTKKEATIHFHHNEISLAELADLLQKIGYKPEINLDQLSNKKKKKNNRILYQIAVAGFAFGNIMFLGFTDYFDTNNDLPHELRAFFGWIAFGLSIPVLVYSASDYFSTAWQGLKHRFINIDIPISLGILALFLQSTYDLYFHQELGYFDSLSALVFFLLLGKLFQDKTYQRLSFERDYKSYFPISILKKIGTQEQATPITELQKGDIIRVKNEEIIPCDSLLLDDYAQIDNSFITGESKEISAKKGALIYAGAKNLGKSILLTVNKEVSQSYLTQLWNQESFDKDYKGIDNITNSVSKYFTIGVLSIALIAFAYWYINDSNRAIYVVSSILIVACPCALALSAPFTLGNSLRIFGKSGFYLKNSLVIEQLAKAKLIVFDKTGTITQKDESSIKYYGNRLSEEFKIIINSLSKQSSHPLSMALCSHLNITEEIHLENYSEIAGKGIRATVNDQVVKLGSAEFTQAESNNASTRIYFSVEEQIIGYFQIEHKFRNHLKSLFHKLSSIFKISILSGDNESSKAQLSRLLPNNSELLFNQKPLEKLKYIEQLQSKGEPVIMVGDGLNDAGALKQSNIGISISEDLNSFTPASDGILDARSFNQLYNYILFTKDSMKIIKASFVISWLYNIVGLYFAVQGLLSPVIAAVLMPISSISVVSFTSLSTKLLAKKRNIN